MPVSAGEVRETGISGDSGQADDTSSVRSKNSAPSRAVFSGYGLNAPGWRRDAGKRATWPETRTLAGIGTTRKRLLGCFTEWPVPDSRRESG